MKNGESKRRQFRRVHTNLHCPDNYDIIAGRIKGRQRLNYIMKTVCRTMRRLLLLQTLAVFFPSLLPFRLLREEEPKKKKQRELDTMNNIIQLTEPDTKKLSRPPLLHASQTFKLFICNN